MKKLYVIAAIGILAIVLGASFGGIWWDARKTAIAKDEAGAEALSNVKVMVQRRFDLIPKLAEAVDKYFTHEQKVFIGTAEERSKQLSDQLASASTPAEIDEIASESAEITDNVIITVQAVTEDYPEIKADQVVMSYMDELAGTENRIAVARERYNAAARSLNTYIKSDFWYLVFWDGLVEPRPYFE